MTLGNERFTIPELLFHPADIGLNQAGLPEMIMQSLHALPGGLWTGMLANVVLVGGNANIRGLLERLYVILSITFVPPLDRFPSRAASTEKSLCFLSVTASLGSFLPFSHSIERGSQSRSVYGW